MSISIPDWRFNLTEQERQTIKTAHDYAKLHEQEAIPYLRLIAELDDHLSETTLKLDATLYLVRTFGNSTDSALLHWAFTEIATNILSKEVFEVWVAEYEAKTGQTWDRGIPPAGKGG